MSISFSAHKRVITIAGFVADDDPNTTPPDASKIFKLDKRDGNGGDADGHILVGKFDTNETGGSAAYQTWFLDVGGGGWYRFPPDTLSHRVGKVTKALQSVDIFVQILSFASPGAATTFTVSATEL